MDTAESQGAMQKAPRLKSGGPIRPLGLRGPAIHRGPWNGLAGTAYHTHGAKSHELCTGTAQVGPLLVSRAPPGPRRTTAHYRPDGRG